MTQNHNAMVARKGRLKRGLTTPPTTGIGFSRRRPAAV